MARFIARLFGEWWSERYPDDQPDGTEFDKDDLLEVFGAGWEACYHARWEPVGGLPYLTPSADLPACRDEDPATPATLAAAYPDPPEYQHPENDHGR